MQPASSADDMERQIDRWAAQVHEKAQRYQELKKDLAKISSTASTANGAITVTVGPSGVVTNLELTDHVRTMQPRYLAQQIMEAMRKAQSRLGPQVTELMQQRVGDDVKSIETVSQQYAAQFPPADDDDQEPGSGRPDPTSGDPAQEFLHGVRPNPRRRR